MSHLIEPYQILPKEYFIHPCVDCGDKNAPFGDKGVFKCGKCMDKKQERRA